MHVTCVCHKGHLSKVPTACELGVMELHAQLSESDMNMRRHGEPLCELKTAPKFDPAT